MKKARFSFASVAILAVTGTVNAAPATLLAHNQRTSSGNLLTLVWNGADGNPASSAVWDWNSSTGVLRMTGLHWATSHISSDPAQLSVIGVEVRNMIIDTGTSTTTASSFICHEGSFYASININGCLNIDFGFNNVSNSSALYNVGGNANCVVRTIGGDDFSTGNPIGLMTAAAGGGCHAVNGAFDLWTIVQDSGGTLILSNGIPTTSPGSVFMTFSVPMTESVVLIGHHQRSGNGTLSKLISNGADGNPASNAVWDWYSTGGVLSMAGLYWATVHLNSNPIAASVAGAEVWNMTIDAGTHTTNASSFICHEGNFLAGLGANGCLNTSTGTNFINESMAVYNVGGNANCIARIILGDDFPTGLPAGLMTAAATGDGCEGVDGLGDLWTVVPDSRFIILANQADIKGVNNCYLFGPTDSATSSPCPVDATIAGAEYMVFALNVDADSDGIVDALDNCTLAANASQCDSDSDGYGNRCDGDMNNNAATNSQDYVLFRQELGTVLGDPYNKADINCNGVVNSQDYVLFRSLLGSPPGPSGL